MTMQQQVLRFGQRRAVGRLSRALPWIGTALALAAFATTVRRKGVVRGTADTALNAVPVIGVLKSLAEFVRGRDFFADRAVPR
jgi:hypothetical protein